ncbi:MAG: hypothetical protein GY913_01040 [Proteobacteria bacterium]|nr:hypothetical protein [Pseudomonadota bacterium]MCP4915483.1 hypothetical protein [Pseudomonadota bacterium]
MWSLLTSLVLAQPGWSELETPEPVRAQPVQRHRELMAEATAGKGASPVFREPWSRMEVDLTIQSYGHEAMWLPDGTQERYRDLSFAAATIGVERLVNEWVDQSDVLVGARYGVRSVIGPNLVVEKRAKGARVRVNEMPQHRYGKVRSAQLERPELGPKIACVRVGAGSRLLTEDFLADEGSIGVAYGAYVQVDKIGIDALRVNVDVASLQLDRRRIADPSGAWSIQGRQRIAPRVALIGEVRSLTGSYEPDRLRGVASVTPLLTNRLWQVRAISTAELASTERKAELRVSYNGRWHMPTDPGRYHGATAHTR